MPTEKVTVDEAAVKLEAFLAFEMTSLRRALKHKDYNFLSPKRLNDQFDADQLMYLAYPNVRFLTSDGGFRSAKNCAQGARVHIVDRAKLEDPTSAIAVLETLLS